jgi:hypothetical protein
VQVLCRLHTGAGSHSDDDSVEHQTCFAHAYASICKRTGHLILVVRLGMQWV